MWIFVGLLLGSMVTSSHDTKEACEGRRVMLTEKGVSGQCVQQPNNLYFSTSGNIKLCTDGICK